MKCLLTAIIVFTCFLTKAQTSSDKICGIWKLSETFYGSKISEPVHNGIISEPINKGKLSELVYNGKLSGRASKLATRYKIFTPFYFTVMDIDSVTNITKTNIFGTYTLYKGLYQEKLTNVTADSANMIGQQFSFTIIFNGDNEFLQVGSFNGMETKEKWVRVLPERQ